MIQTSPIFQKCTRKYVPVFMSALVTLAGANPPWNSPSRYLVLLLRTSCSRIACDKDTADDFGILDKIAWIQKDITGWCRDYSIPWKAGWPAEYPKKTSTLHVGHDTVCTCSILNTNCTLRSSVCSRLAVNFIPRHIQAFLPCCTKRCGSASEQFSDQRFGSQSLLKLLE